jgi:hypothetical protein
MSCPPTGSGTGDWAVAKLLRETLASLKLGYPPPDFDIDAERARLTA